MAPAGLLSPAVTVQSLHSPTSCAEKWQPKRLVPSSGSVLARSSSNATVGNTLVKSSIPLCPLNAAFRSRRRSCLGPNARGASRHVLTATVEESVAVEETAAVSEESAADSVSVEEVAAPVAYPRQSTGKFKPRIPGQKMRREDAVVPPEALIAGAVFKGKVTTILPFGAFVDFGAFTDGLVHISKLTSGYVSNVSDIVTIGQEVTVTILNVEQTSGRIALTMREDKEPTTQGEASDGSRVVQGSDGRPINRGRIAGGRQTRRDEPQKPPTKLVKGETVEGTVKNKIRSGVFVLLPGDEEGFLRYSDIPGGENMVSESSLQTGQQVKATVLRIDRGNKIVLTMKSAVDMISVNRDINKGQSLLARNPFEIAFRSLNFIPEAVSEPEQATDSAEEASRTEGIALSELATDSAEEASPGEEGIAVPERVTDSTEEASRAEEGIALLKQATDSAGESVVEEGITLPEQATNSAEEPSRTQEGITLPEQAADFVEEASPTEDSIALPEQVIDSAEEASPTEEDIVLVEQATDSAEQASPAQESITLAEQGSASVEEASPKEDDILFPEEAAASVGAESPAEKSIALPEQATDSAEEASPAEEGVLVVDAFEPESTPVEKAPEQKEPSRISAALVKQLRDETGAGMMDCKKALAETEGDLEKARETLRKKGLASADKKASRIASEGLVGSYVHDSRIGVLVEVNCETDFVSRGKAFKSLVEDMGMQVVASQQVKYVSVEDIPAEVVTKEKVLEAQREDLLNKPEAIRSKIVDGRVSKRLIDFALLEQPYIRDDKILVKDLVKQTVATLGENIKVRRFERYVLGEGLQKKSSDFAAEVIAQTAVKAPSEAPKAEETPAPAEDKSPAAPAVVVPAALVKELRDQTGAGMMDSKKALAATANDLEKAVEFLRKKGLASADKKASRLASEGLIGTYIHDGRIGVLVEVNCETDFVARGDKFKELVEDLAMQVAAYPQVQVVSVDDVPAELLAKERDIESGKEDLASKPEAIRSRIVEGRVTKRLAELALLEQPFIKDDKKTVKDVVKETVASLGENIQVRRFTRFNLGEGIQKKVVDFAAEVAAQTAVKV